jgi:branched-chain amino acid transport system permease protein
MNQLLVSLVGGAALGGAFALVGLGLVLAYRATFTLSFAHGQLMLLPAFIVGMWQSNQVAPFGISVLFALALSATICVLFYLVVLQRLVGLPHFMSFVATLGLASILDGVMALIFGSNQYFIKIPGLSDGVTTIFGARISSKTLILSVFTLVLAAAVVSVLRFTELGIRIRAAGHDPVLASKGGINVRVLYAGSWAVAGVLAAVAGIVFGSINLVDVSLSNLALAAFPVILLGGLDSIEGAIVGGIIIGVIQGFVATYLGGEYQDVVTYGLLLIVLLVYPQGLFGTRSVARV